MSHELTNNFQNSNYLFYNILKLDANKFSFCISIAVFKIDEIQNTLRKNIFKMD